MRFGLISWLELPVVVDWLETSVLYPYEWEGYLGFMITLERAFVDHFRFLNREAFLFLLAPILSVVFIFV